MRIILYYILTLTIKITDFIKILLQNTFSCDITRSFDK